MTVIDAIDTEDRRSLDRRSESYADRFGMGDLLLVEALLMHCELVLSEGNFVADLHLVEKPVRVALQYLSEVDADIAGGFAEAVHDAAQRGFMDSQHARQTVLPDARGVHPQLEVRVDVSIQAHVIALGFFGVAASRGEWDDCSCNSQLAIIVPKSEALFVNILLIGAVQKVPEKLLDFRSIRRYEASYSEICN
jgi:hypothetical protein